MGQSRILVVADDGSNQLGVGQHAGLAGPDVIVIR